MEIEVYAVEEAEAIRRLLGKTAESVIEIGHRLIRLKERIPHGEWARYLKREFDWTERSAQRFMSVAHCFNSDNLSDLKIGPSALYLLASNSTPEPVRSAILDRAKAGERITHTAVKEAIEATHPRVIVDEEFSKILPPLRPEELQGLELGILDWGCLNPLLVWKDHGILLDGHQRYAICKKRGIPFKVREVEISSREEAKIFIIRRQLVQRNYAPKEIDALRAKLKAKA